MLQVVLALSFVALAFLYLGIRIYRFVLSIRTKNKENLCKDCPLVNECTSNVEQKEKCHQTTSDISKEDLH